MAKSEKKVSINTIDNTMSEHFQNCVSEQWHGVELKMTQTLSLKDMLAFVNDVVNSCFQKDGSFVPEILDFAVRSNIISRYTNVSLPDNLEHRYDILYKTDLVKFVSKHINNEQESEILDAIKAKLTYLCNTNTMSVQNRLNNLVAAFEELQKKTEALFDGVSPDDVSKLIGAVGSSGLNEDRLVEAYLKQKNKPHDSGGEVENTRD